jgi:hypothetical protein
MITALFSFLGGSVFRLIFGEVMSMLNKKQDHAQEVERMQLQGQLDAAQQDRTQAGIKLQADLGIKTIQVQAESAIGQIEADGWLEAVKATSRSIGVAWVDAWNALIRPAVATWSIGMMTANYAGWIKLDDNGWSICGLALGLYLASRDLFKRGK